MFPSYLQGIFGAGAPTLYLHGRERVTWSGTSRWRPFAQGLGFGKDGSRLPAMKLDHELEFALTGSLGDKVFVDMSRSNQSIPLSERTMIRYRGYRDDFIQKIDIGNTRVDLPGVFAGYSRTARGMKALSARASHGPWDITAIGTREEKKAPTRSVIRTGESRTVRIADLDYVSGKYFFLLNPDSCLWQLDEASLGVFIDDRIGTNDQIEAAKAGRATISGAAAPGSSTYRGMFRQLTPGEPPIGEFRIEREIYTGHPVLVLNRPLDEGDVLAVLCSGWRLDRNLQREDPRFTVGDATGDSLQLKLVRPSRSDPRVDLTDLTAGPWAPVRNLELKNIYDLGARGILKDGFECRIRLQKTVGGVQPDRVGDITFLQMTGLDLSRETSTGLVPGRDDRIDPQFISYANGILMFPDLRPFDPDAIDLGMKPVSCPEAPFYRFLPWKTGDGIREARPAALPGLVDADSAVMYRAPAIYDRVLRWSPQADSHYVIEVTYRSPVSRIQLNAFGILPGSESVTVGDRTLVRDREYRIDYDTGEVEILDAANVTVTDEVNVTFSYSTGGDSGRTKTVAGIAAYFRPVSDVLTLSSSVITQTVAGPSGLKEGRAWLGMEPSRTVIGDATASATFRSDRVSRLVSGIPGAAKEMASWLNVSSAIGVSYADPNTKGVIYLDDFDDAKESVSCSLDRGFWRPSSIPISQTLPGGDLPRPMDRDSIRAEAKGELWWCSPRNAARESDFQPTLEAREGDNTRQILRMRFFPRGRTPEEKKNSWAGVTQVLSTRGSDLSRAQFLDVWVNDYRQYRPHPDLLQERRGKLVIDLGTVSEDAMWYRNDPAHPEQYSIRPPNGRLDTEDQNRDGHLDQGMNLNEDTGLDGKMHGTPGADPFDLYDYDDNLPESNPRKYASVNGTEGSQELDTEDMNGNGSLDKLNSYFQVAIDLADSTLWETDVYRDYVFKNPIARPGVITPDNGWRRIRIPLQDDSLVSRLKDFEAGNPDWEKVFQLRMWLTGFDDSTDVEIGGVDVVGCRWNETAIRDQSDRLLPDSLLAPGESFHVGVVNDRDDGAVYSPPVSGPRGSSGGEQSIALNLSNFQPGHRAGIYRTYSMRQNFMSYENLEFFLAHRVVQGSTDLTCSVRLCRDVSSDTTNYYEYRCPVPAAWQEVDIDLQSLSRLQLATADSVTGSVTQSLGGGVTITRRGSPNLAFVQRISFIVSNTPGPQGHVLENGSVWIDELRLTGARRETGQAMRVGIGASLANLARLDFQMSRTGAEFATVDARSGSGLTSTAWRFDGSSDLAPVGKLLGWSAPVRLSIADTKAVPRLRAGTDVILNNPGDLDIYENREVSYTMRLYKERSSARWSQLILEPFSFDGGYVRQGRREKSLRDTFTTRQGAVQWRLVPGKWGEKRLAKDLCFTPLPTMLTANVTGTDSRRQRSVRANLRSPFVSSPRSRYKSASFILTGEARPLSPVRYRIEEARNLITGSVRQELLGINMGRETGRTQALSVAYDLPVLRRALAPRISWWGKSRVSGNAVYDEGGGRGGTRRYSMDNSRELLVTGRLSVAQVSAAAAEILGSGRAGDSDRSHTGGVSGEETSLILASGRTEWLALDPLALSYRHSHITNLSRRRGLPSLAYQLGLSAEPGGGSRPGRSASSRRENGETVQAEQVARVLGSASVGLRYYGTKREWDESANRVKTETRRWPEVDIHSGALQDLLGLDGPFRELRAWSRFSRERLSSPNASTRSAVFAPLFDLTATLQSDLSATVSASYRSSESEQRLPAWSKQRGRDGSIRLAIEKTLGKRRNHRIETSRHPGGAVRFAALQGQAARGWNKLEIAQRGLPTVVLSDRTYWSLTGRVRIDPCDRVSGSFEVRVSEEKDRRNRALTARSAGILASTEITF